MGTQHEARVPVCGVQIPPSPPLTTDRLEIIATLNRPPPPGPGIMDNRDRAG